MKTREIRDLSGPELQTKLTEARQEMFNLRFQLATRQLNNTARLSQVRKDIAKIKTIMREKMIAEAV